MVSAETAVSLIAAANVALLLFAVLASAMSYLHAQDLSRAAARSLSLGQEQSQIVSDIRHADPEAAVDFASDGALGAVTVRLPSAGPAGRLGIHVSATTVAALEPGADS